MRSSTDGLERRAMDHRAVYGRRRTSIVTAVLLVLWVSGLPPQGVAASFVPSGTLYVDHLLLDDCVDNLPDYPSGSRELWRVSASGAVPRLRGLSGYPIPAAVLWFSFSPAGDAVVYADQQRDVRVAQVDLARMAFVSSGTRLSAFRARSDRWWRHRRRTGRSLRWRARCAARRGSGSSTGMARGCGSCRAPAGPQRSHSTGQPLGSSRSRAGWGRATTGPPSGASTATAPGCDRSPRHRAGRATRPPGGRRTGSDLRSSAATRATPGTWRSSTCRAA